MIHPNEEKLYIVCLLKSGYPLKRLCRERSLDRHQVRQWLLMYDKYGEDGIFHPIKDSVFSPAKREQIVKEHIEQGVTLKELSIKHNVARKSIDLWLRKVRMGGSLHDIKQRGRPRKISN